MADTTPQEREQAAPAPAATETAAPAEERQPYFGRPPRREGGRPGGREFRPRRKVCSFCIEKAKEIDYKDVPRLRRYLSDRGKIDPRRKTGTCAKHQRRLSTALKRARFMALLPYTGDHVRTVERAERAERAERTA
ncbi:MAG: 30S ribosomal protein S18 [Chloroflexi bacterium]|nr:30S ribosomal protein S18 [Chloroflexota bacterium]